MEGDGRGEHGGVQGSGTQQKGSRGLLWHIGRWANTWLNSWASSVAWPDDTVPTRASLNAPGVLPVAPLILMYESEMLPHRHLPA